MTSSDGILSARLHGAWQDRALDFDAGVHLDGNVLRIAFDDSKPKVIALAVDVLRGVHVERGA